MTTIRDWLQQATIKLAEYAAVARLESDLLLCHVLKKPRSYLFAYPEQYLDKEQQTLADALLKKRITGEPMAYLLGYREFYSLEFEVSPATLIPRPETELLVDAVLKLSLSRTNPKILDLGTGTGAIAILIAKHRPSWQIYAVDNVEEALDVAKKNADKHQCFNMEFIHSNWFTDLKAIEFDVVVSNPPYIAEDDPHLHEGDVRFEPRTALVSQQAGLADIIHIVNNAWLHLRTGGHLLIEHGYQQGKDIRELFERRGYVNINTLPDMNGLERITEGVRP